MSSYWHGPLLLWFSDRIVRKRRRLWCQDVEVYTAAQVGGLDEPFTVPTGRGDQARHAGEPDPREIAGLRKVRDVFIRDLHIDTIAVKGRNFR